MAINKTAYLYDDIYLDHETGWGHPEQPERLVRIHKKISSAPYYKELVRIKPSPADIAHIEMIHSRDYIGRVKREIEQGVSCIDSMDTTVSSRSYEVALYAAGGSLNMCDAVMRDQAVNGFCAIRPPGHHAEKNYAAGFCIFNNIAIAARYLQRTYSLKNVAIVDWDVHHGNGTQHSFEDDNSIFYISLHQYPHYPGTGSNHEIGVGRGKGFTQNYPMRHSSGDEEYRFLFENRIVPALHTFKPDIVLVSAGFDAHKADPLSSILLSTEMFYTFTRMLMAVANEHSQGRIIAFLEGGYNLSVLPDCVDMVMKAFVEN